MDGTGARAAALHALALYLPWTLLNVYYLPPLAAVHPALYWTADAVQFVAVPALGWMLLRRAGWQLADLGLRTRRERHAARAETVGSVLVFGLLLAGLAFPAGLLLQHLFWFDPGNAVSTQSMMPRGGALRLAVALYLAVTAAFVEEVMFRALPWVLLRERLSTGLRQAGYVAVSALVFAIAHAEQGMPGMLASGWYGVLAAAVFLRSRSLWPCVAGHFLVDLATFGPWG